ncbi:MAG: transposase [Ignavibacteriales bacterium]|nr:transposase [Ignavibacteriales bacterium]
MKESGRSLKKTSGITKQGNSTLRTLLYLSALSASKYNHACKELSQRLLTKGKKKKTALIAVANKLIKQLFVIVKSNSIFINNYNLNLVS